MGTLLKKIPGEAKSVTMIALIYFLYSVFDSRYAAQAEVNSLKLDIVSMKATISHVKEDTTEIKKDLKKLMEKYYDRK